MNITGNNLKTGLYIAGVASAAVGGAAALFGDGYMAVAAIVLSAPILYFITQRLLAFFDTKDILAPQYIMPALFVFIALLGALGGSKISVLHIAKVQEFKWHLYLLAMAAYFSGMGFASFFRFPARQPRAWDIGISISFLKIFFVLGLAAMFLYFQAKGGIPVLQSNIDTARFKSAGGFSVILPYLGRLLMITAVLGFICLARLEKGAKGRQTLVILIVLSILVLSLGGGRMPFVELSFIGLTVFHYMRKQLKTKHMLAGAALLFLLFSLAGYYRSENKLGHKFISSQLERIKYPEALPAWTSPPYVYSRIVAEVFHLTVEKVPEKIPYQRGAITFGDFLTFMPGKQLRPDSYFTESVLEGDSKTSGGTALSFMTSFYFDYGPVGIAAGFFIVGFLLTLIYLKMKKSGEFYLALYAILLFNSILGVYGTILFSPFTMWDFSCVIIFHFLVAVLAPFLLKRRGATLLK